MPWYARPFALIHKLIGYVIFAVLGSTAFLGIAAVIVSILGIILGAVAYIFLWAILAFLCFIVGWMFYMLVRLFYPEYQRNAAAVLQNAGQRMQKASGDLRQLAKDSL